LAWTCLAFSILFSLVAVTMAPGWQESEVCQYHQSDYFNSRICFDVRVEKITFVIGFLNLIFSKYH
jgi:hypothetical protein